MGTRRVCHMLRQKPLFEKKNPSSVILDFCVQLTSSQNSAVYFLLDAKSLIISKNILCPP